MASAPIHAFPAFLLTLLCTIFFSKPHAAFQHNYHQNDGVLLQKLSERN